MLGFKNKSPGYHTNIPNGVCHPCSRQEWPTTRINALTFLA